MPDFLPLYALSPSDYALRVNAELFEKVRRDVNPETAHIVIASWENEFAKAGGVEAVTQAYAQHLASIGRLVTVITPLHTGTRRAPGPLSPAGVAWLDFEGERHRVEFLHRIRGGVRWIFLHAPGFFDAEGGIDRSDPYCYGEGQEANYREWQQSVLRLQHGMRKDLGGGPAESNEVQGCLERDCLLFAQAAPKAVALLDGPSNVVLHLQDWETVALALTSKQAMLNKELPPTISCLALHNPYDKPLCSRAWQDLGGSPVIPGAASFLSRFMPFLDAPPTTVSHEFARDLVSDPLQTVYFADHLQAHFKQFQCPAAPGGIQGVDNGPFHEVSAPFSETAVAAAAAGRPETILEEKLARRREMKAILAVHYPGMAAGESIGIDYANLDDDEPLFICIGRLDPRQKGFDVAARAVERVLTDGSRAKFVFAAIPGGAPSAYIRDLEELAERHAGSVAVFLTRMAAGFIELQAGSSFSLWPSFYEPFGGVSEFLLRGTPIVARSTGGLRQQIKPFDAATGRGNGLLYDAAFTENRWELENILDAQQPADRMAYPSYRGQVEKLAATIHDAADMYANADRRTDYAKLLANSYESVVGKYSWERAAREYGEMYQTGVC